ncbi:fish-egg lectin-like protein [Labeo rohita]|uniref:Fish-egg lectin-like protein n=1 Tax=Labeo rohita TaxID=84645 RepID=A0A498M0T1_LABRO|nr:fish-egg lectin-like protein [Labeo rohita]
MTVFCMRAQNEAAGTYESLQLSAPPSEYETLNISRDAPKISNSSSCIRTNVTVCFCEADGNPFPELRWHLSGRPVTNSSNMFISEERLSSTGLRSSITLLQSLTHTSTLQCVSNNTHGNASQLLHLPSSVARKLKYYSCGPYSCWGVNTAGNIVIRRGVNGVSCGGSGVFDVVSGSMSMVEVATDGSIFAIDNQGSLFQRTGVSSSNPIGTALNCEVIPGTLKQIDAGLGIVGGVNDENEVFLFLGTRFEKINSSLKHFTVGPAGQLGADSLNNVFKFADGSFQPIPGIQLKQVDAGGDQIIVGVSPIDDVFCLNKDANNVRPSGDAPWVQLAGKLKYYSCGPYSCWGVNAAGNIVIRRSVTGASCGGLGAFEAVAGSLSMVEVSSDGNIFGVDAQGNLLQRKENGKFSQTEGTERNGQNTNESESLQILLAHIAYPNGLKHVTFDRKRLCVISDGSIRRHVPEKLCVESFH